MMLDPSFEPNLDLKGSYYRRVDDIRDALNRFGVSALLPNAPALFVAYYFGVEKPAKAIVGIKFRQPPKAAFRRPVDLPATKKAADCMKLEITDAELDALFDNEQPTSAIKIRDGLSHDFGPTRVIHVNQHAPRLIPIMVRFIADIDLVLEHLHAVWAAEK